LEPQFDDRRGPACRREKKIWRHNDVGHLEDLLAAEAPERPKLIVFEALYSMDGDVAPVNRICLPNATAQ
jgi:7-keto-8-aminopelargonate synthetase-like enzyme